MLRVDAHVDATAFRAVRAELFQFDRQLLGKLNSRIKRAVAPAKEQAESNAARIAGITDSSGKPSGIARKYARGRKGVTVKVGGRTSRGSDNDAVVRLIVNNGAAAMAEFAAGSSTDAGAALVGKFGRMFGGTGRIAWDAVDSHEESILADIQDEIRKTEAEFSARLAGGSASGVIY